MELTLGFSPCPNDTFIMHALLSGLAVSEGIAFTPVIEDVETLNRMALEGKLDITKLSYHAFLHVRDTYDLLQSGSALGHGVGPLLIGKHPLPEKDVLAGPIAIPGRLTTASMLFSLRYPDAANIVELPFHQIEQAILDGKVAGGVIIHENRFTYQQKGLVKTIDLGEYWESETGAPIPLGGFFARKALGPETRDRVDALIRESVSAAFQDPTASEAYVRLHAQEMSPAVIRQHINLYVNDFTLDLGKEGREAVNKLMTWKKMPTRNPSH